MKYTVVDSAEWMYPDITNYMSASASAELCGLTGGTASFQLLITDAPRDGISVTFSGISGCVYRLRSVMVEGNPGFDGKPLTNGTEGFNSPDMADETDGSDPQCCSISDHIPSQPCRRAPCRVYDCICPLGNAGERIFEYIGIGTYSGVCDGEAVCENNNGECTFDRDCDCGRDCSFTGAYDGGECPSEAAAIVHQPFSQKSGGVSTGSAEDGGVIALYITVDCQSAGEYSGYVSIGDVNVPVDLRVYPSPVPEETLKIAVGYYPYHTVLYHGVKEGSEEHRALDEKYLRIMRRGRQNVLYLDGPLCNPSENGWKFDFSYMEHRVKQGLRLGYRYFFINGIGFRKSWDAANIIIRGMDSESEEAELFLKEYFAALSDFLEARGWTDNFAIGVADEPNAVNIGTYKRLCEKIRRFCPRLKLYDAVSYLPELEDSLDICVPRADEYYRHMEQFDSLKDKAEVWHYVCLFPRGEGYINRFIDMPLLATRYLFWGNFRYRLSGFLHWAANGWQDGQNPFECNCPQHINAGSRSTLPPGDSHNIYPGDKEPWMSMRLEAQRESAEDYEMLLAISKRDPKLAEGLCGKCFKSFKSVEYNVSVFRKTRKKLLEEYCKCFE